MKGSSAMNSPDGKERVRSCARLKLSNYVKPLSLDPITSTAEGKTQCTLKLLDCVDQPDDISPPLTPQDSLEDSGLETGESVCDEQEAVN